MTKARIFCLSVVLAYLSGAQGVLGQTKSSGRDDAEVGLVSGGAMSSQAGSDSLATTMRLERALDGEVLVLKEGILARPIDGGWHLMDLGAGVRDATVTSGGIVFTVVGDTVCVFSPEDGNVPMLPAPAPDLMIESASDSLLFVFSRSDDAPDGISTLWVSRHFSPFIPIATVVGPIRDVAFRADSLFVATNEALLWGLYSDKATALTPLIRLRDAQINRIGFQRDGGALLVAAEKGVAVVDLQSPGAVWIDTLRASDVADVPGGLIVLDDQDGMLRLINTDR